MKPVLASSPPLAVLEPTPAPRGVEWRPGWHAVEPSESHWRPAESIGDALRAARRLDIRNLAGLELRDAETRRPLATPHAEEAP